VGIAQKNPRLALTNAQEQCPPYKQNPLISGLPQPLNVPVLFNFSDWWLVIGGQWLAVSDWRLRVDGWQFQRQRAGGWCLVSSCFFFLAIL